MPAGRASQRSRVSPVRRRPAGGYDSSPATEPAASAQQPPTWRARGNSLTPIAQAAWENQGTRENNSPSNSPPKMRPALSGTARGRGGVAAAPSSPICARNHFRSEWMKLCKEHAELSGVTQPLHHPPPRTPSAVAPVREKRAGAGSGSFQHTPVYTSVSNLIVPPVGAVAAAVPRGQASSPAISPTLNSTVTSVRTASPLRTPAAERAAAAGEDAGREATNRLFDQVYGGMKAEKDKEAFARKLFHMAVLGAKSMPELRLDAAQAGLLGRRFASMQSMLRQGQQGSQRPINRGRMLIADSKLATGSFRVATAAEVSGMAHRNTLDIPDAIDANLDSDGESDDLSHPMSSPGRPYTQGSPGSIPYTSSIASKASVLKANGERPTPDVSFTGSARAGSAELQSVDDSGSCVLSAAPSRRERYAQLRNPEVLAQHASGDTLLPVYDVESGMSYFADVLMADIDNNPAAQYLEQFESFRTIADHNIVETTELSKGEDLEGNKKINEYAVICELGRGSYAKVKLVCQDSTDQPYALKIMNKSLLKKVKKHGGVSALEQVRVELAIMKKIAHPRIVRLHQVIDDASADKMYLLLDYIDGGTICEIDAQGKAEPIDARLMAKYLRQMCSALDYLHRHNIVHRDIKPSNILVDKNEAAYLCDFGVSTILQGSAQIEGIEGTPFFFAPEMCEGGEFDGKVADLWALGATAFVCLLGHVPFFATDAASIMDKIQNDAVAVPYDADPDVKSLLRGMMNKSAKKRMTLDELRVHPFIVMEGEAHPSAQYGDPIVISFDDVENAFTQGNGIDPRKASLATSASFTRKMYKKGAAAMAARRYCHRYCQKIRQTIKERKARASRELKERQRAKSVTPPGGVRQVEVEPAETTPDPFLNLSMSAAPFSPDTKRELKNFRRMTATTTHTDTSEHTMLLSPDFLVSACGQSRSSRTQLSDDGFVVGSPCLSVSPDKGSSARSKRHHGLFGASLDDASESERSPPAPAPTAPVIHVSPMPPRGDASSSGATPRSNTLLTPTTPNEGSATRPRRASAMVLDKSGNVTTAEDEGEHAWEDVLFSSAVPVPVGSPARAARSRGGSSACGHTPEQIVVSPPTDGGLVRSPRPAKLSAEMLLP